MVGDAPMSLTPEQIAWCAGVIDAIGLIRTRETYTGSQLAYVGVSTAQVQIAERLSELTGTRPTRVTRDYNRVGCADHCDEAHLHVQSVTARWSLTGARALTFLAAIQPYLTMRAADAERVIKATADAPSKARTVQKMTALGWPERNAA